MNTTACPSCGEPASGRFCSHCAAPLAGATCPSCNAPLSSGAKFCHSCGTPVGRRAQPNLPWPWISAIGAAAVVFGVFGYVAGQSLGKTTALPTAPPSQFGAGQIPRATTDLSTMSPREQADRLFDRIMMAHEAGDTAQVSFFLPMTIEAYGLLGGLDGDARYHMGLLHSISGNTAGIMAQADSLLAENPAHLIAFMLRNIAHQALGETAAASEDLADFLEHYDAEMAAPRPEYQAHRTSITAFLEVARAARGKTGTG